MAGSSMSATKLLSAALTKGSGPRMLASTLPLRSGMGMAVGTRPPPSQPLPEDHELEWDDGSPFPEPCVDHVAPMVGKYEALAWLSGGLSVFGLVGILAAWNDKASKIPYTPREYPGDLRVELGKEP